MKRNYEPLPPGEALIPDGVYENTREEVESMKGLVIKSPWIEKILSGEKTWEIRGSRTTIRGRIALIKSGSGKIFGSVELVDCLPLTMYEWSANKDKHQVPYGQIDYKTPYAWVLRNPIIYSEPEPYKHPQGAVIWVNLGGESAWKDQSRLL